MFLFARTTLTLRMYKWNRHTGLALCVQAIFCHGKIEPAWDDPRCLHIVYHKHKVCICFYSIYTYIYYLTVRAVLRNCGAT